METLRRALHITTALALTAGVTVVFRAGMAAANTATVGFAYLLVVLVAASLWGWIPALLAAVAATAQYNFYFLPPVGSFTIVDPQNWVALSSLLITAAIASRLSAAARKRAAEAEARRQDTARLYELSRAMLVADPAREAEAIEHAVVRIFNMRDARIELSAEGAPAQASFNQHWSLRIGQQSVGTLWLAGPALALESGEAIAGMVAIALERARLQKQAARLQALREGEALKAALLDDFTHQLRTPLAAIKGAATALTGGPALTAPARELAEVVAEEADHLDALLENMLEMARIEAGDVRPHLRPEPLEPFLREALAGETGSDLRVELEPGLPPVMADAPLTARALLHLIANARAYASGSGEIIVTAKRDGERVRISVCDRGPGFSDADLPNLFDKFYRSRAASRHRPEGLGMGLAIVRGLIIAQGGSVGAANSAGGGACVWMTLPVDGQRDQSGEEPVPPPAIASRAAL